MKLKQDTSCEPHGPQSHSRCHSTSSFHPYICRESVKITLCLIIMNCLNDFGLYSNFLSTLTCNAFSSYPQTSSRRYSENPSLKQSSFLKTNIQQHFLMKMSSATSGVSDIVTDLQKKTVKDLKEEIRNLSPPPPRGILSKLKLKKELIDFLADRYLQNSKNKEQDADSKVHDAAGDTKKKPKKNKRLTMPSITSHLVTESDEINDVENATSPIFKSRKDLIFDEVAERYPGLQSGARKKGDQNSEETIMEDIRSKYHPMLLNAANNGEMDLNFVGTASCTPGVSRGVSCTALRLNWRRVSFNSGEKDGKGKKKKKDKYNPSYQYDFSGGTWLFDAGECTQLQLQKSPTVKAGKVTKIFVSHCHGDHSFGLPGLLCLMGQDRPKEADSNGKDFKPSPPVDIYGPEGLRMWLRIAIRYSASRIVPHYRVHELMDVPMAPEWKLVRDYNNGRCRFFYDLNRIGKSGNNKQWMNQWGKQGLAGEDPNTWITQCRDSVHIERDEYFGELDGGRDIRPQYDHPLCAHGAPIWDVLDEGDVNVRAAPMSHGVPTVGFVIKEENRPGRLKPELVAPVIERNIPALKEAGVKSPMKIMSVIKNLPPDGAFNFPDGTVIKATDVVEPPREGRKVVILGDTACTRAIENLSQNADVIVHEATNAYLEGLDIGANLYAVTKDARTHGHSTPQMAGSFAKRVNAKRLVMNHFSARYKGDESLESCAIMLRIEKQAIKASGLPIENVAAAWDFMTVPIPSN